MATGGGVSAVRSSVQAGRSDRQPYQPCMVPNQRNRRYHGRTGNRQRDGAEKGKGRPLPGPPSPSYPLACGSVRRLVSRGLVVGGLVGGHTCRGRRGRAGLDAVQEVSGRLQRLVVLGIRRNIGLRARLLVAI